MTPDLVNGTFELAGAGMLWRNVFQLHRDKEVRGVAIGPTAFFFAWGCWNLYYYPTLGQVWSFVGGACLTLANLVWVSQMIYYRRRAWRSQK